MNAPILPIPRSPVTVRVATPADLPFIDSLQKRHAKQVGWMPTKALEQKVAAGEVIVAEATGNCGLGIADCGLEDAGAGLQSAIRNPKSAIAPVGYCIASDRYMKREDVGVIYQLNVLPARQRGLIGATLVRAMFDRAAYGCRLFCCWCAQDIEANRFWESLGFLPLAFRAGSREKGRVHIFWQRRIRAGDATTPYWFPSRTTSGSIREDRLVFPIPPGVHWRDAMPRVLPEEKDEGGRRKDEEAKALPSPRRRASASSGRGQSPHPLPFGRHPSSLRRAGKLPVSPTPPATTLGRLQFTRPPEPKAEPPARRQPKPKVKSDPRFVAAARELRDRWLERVNADPSVFLPEGKYDVSRTLREVEGSREIGEPVQIQAGPMKLLPAA